MRRNFRCLKTLIAVSSLSTLLTFSEASAVAQDSAVPTDQTIANQNADQNAGNQNLQQMTVTGYIVPHVGEGAQPVLNLGQEYIAKQGVQTVSDLLQRLPQNVGGFTPGVSAGSSFSPGSSAVSLYGLGPSHTLVLIDGFRQTLPPFPQNGYQPFVDLNSIPLAAVDSIDIEKDGASATYGSDAIAGVVNVRLKDSYEGGDVRFYYGISQRDDDEVFHVQALRGELSAD
jgi:iron complex outermembrane recepter protein